MTALLRAALAAAAAASIACGMTTSDPATTPETPPTTSEAGTTAPTEPTTVSSQDPGTIPAGQELDVRLQSSLSSETATVEQRFQTTTAVDLMQNGQVLVPAGTEVRGVVSGVDPAERLDRAGSLTLSFDQMVLDGREIPIRATATQVFESEGIRGEVGTAGVGAGVGGIIGGVLGGVKGALLGAVIGAGGAIVATEGEDITLPAGSIIRLRLDAPVEVR